MAQATFAEPEHEMKKYRTRRGRFLEKMGAPLPWTRPEAAT